MDAEKRRTAANNIVALAKEETGAELLQKCNAIPQLCKLVDDADHEIVVSAIRAFSKLCEGSEDRSWLIYQTLGPARILSLLQRPHDYVPAALANMLRVALKFGSGLAEFQARRDAYQEKKRVQGPQGLGPPPRFQAQGQKAAFIDEVVHLLPCMFSPPLFQ